MYYFIMKNIYHYKIKIFFYSQQNMHLKLPELQNIKLCQ